MIRRTFKSVSVLLTGLLLSPAALAQATGEPAPESAEPAAAPKGAEQGTPPPKPEAKKPPKEKKTPAKKDNQAKAQATPPEQTKAPATSSSSETLRFQRRELVTALAALEAAETDFTALKTPPSQPAPALAPAPAPAPAPADGGTPAPGDAGWIDPEPRQVEAPPADPAAQKAALAHAQKRVSIARENVAALEATVATLNGAKVDINDLEVALKYQKDQLAVRQAALRALQAQATAPSTEQTKSAEAAVKALEETVKQLEARSTTRPSKPQSRTEQEQKARELANGSLINYGPTVSLLQYRVSRPANESGRTRHYESRLELVPPEFGFQFVHSPAEAPWRYSSKDGKSFQLMSWGGMLTARVDADDPQRGALGLAATLSFFEQTLGLGMGVDLYRGIPIATGEGSGRDTALTGVLAWAFAPEGEVTPENVFVVVSLGLEPIVRGLTGGVH